METATQLESRYGIIKAKSSLPQRDLLVVPHKGGDLIVGYPAFGPDSYPNNLGEMQKKYSNTGKYPVVSFREPTISESVSAAAYNFRDMAKKQILDLRWLQLGRIVRTSEGVFANPPKDDQGKIIIDEQVLKSFLNGAEKVNGIYLATDPRARDFGFAPYSSFTSGIQDASDFEEGGLARLLENTEEKSAHNLGEIASKRNYKSGVNVFRFDKAEKPALRVASLYSDRDFVNGRLNVDGWYVGGGCAFGVLD